MLEVILEQVRHRMGVHDAGGIRAADVAHDLALPTQTVVNVLDGKHWPNLHVLLQILSVVELRLVAVEGVKVAH